MKGDSGSDMVTLPTSMSPLFDNSAFSFSYPTGAIGFSSSWLSSGDPTNRAFAVTHRRSVRMRIRQGPSDWAPTSAGVSSPFPAALEKHPQGTLQGLASGAGSALIWETKSSSVKLKRCGVHAGGEAPPALAKRSAHFDIRSGLVLSSTDTEPWGGMWHSDAVHELACQARLRADGFSCAYEPLGVYDLGDRLGMAAFRTLSDLRVDELLFMAFTPRLAELAAEGRIAYDPVHGVLETHEVDACGAFLEDTAIHEQLLSIGRAIGGLYARLHDAGYLRGVGNSWVGNDVVGPDGLLTVVDLDECIIPEQTQAIRYRTTHQRWEWIAATASLYTFMETNSCHFLSLAAAFVVEAAHIGYSQRLSPAVSAEVLHDIVRNFREAQHFWAPVASAEGS